jgi:hypothetical protein
MTSPALPRRVAAFLLQSAIFIAPHDTLDWGHAMLAELHHVQGNWAALLWSLGSAGVLAKHTLLSLIFPGRNRSTVPSGGGLLIKEGPVRKPALAVTAACVIASLLFFFAPVFRQAVRVSLLPWEFVFRTDHSRLSPELQCILKKAEKDRDADALAFVAFQHPEGTEAARLGDEAVRLDASLTWVYGIVAVRGSSFQLHRWVPSLEKFDPQNALPHLIAAQKIEIEQVLHGNVPQRPEDEHPAWQNAMAAAFQSPKLDIYSSQRKALHRRVLNRYHVSDPELIADDYWFYGLPSYGVANSFRYAELLLASAQVAETQGDDKAASDKYLSIAHFGKLLTPSTSMFCERTEQAYTRLAALAAKSSRPEEAAFYAFLADQERETKAQESSPRYVRFMRNQVAHWDADLARRSGAAMLLSGALLLATVFAVFLRSGSFRLSSLRPGGIAIALGVSSSLAFFSQALFCVSAISRILKS